jgi:hypothetical protein
MDAVFLCLSSPWTPEERDGDFYRLVRTLALRSGTCPKFIGHSSDSMNKEYRRLNEP